MSLRFKKKYIAINSGAGKGYRDGNSLVISIIEYLR